MNRRLRLFAEIIAVLAILLSSCVKDSQPGKDDNTEVGPGGDDNGGDNGDGDNGGGIFQNLPVCNHKRNQSWDKQERCSCYGRGGET